MKKIRVVATKCLPTYLPISQTVLAFLAMDYWHASEVLRGIVYTIGGIIWAGVLFVVFNQEIVDIFAKDIQLNGAGDPERLAREVASVLRRQSMAQKGGIT